MIIKTSISITKIKRLGKPISPKNRKSWRNEIVSLAILDFRNPSRLSQSVIRSKQPLTTTSNQIKNSKATTYEPRNSAAQRGARFENTKEVVENHKPRISRRAGCCDNS